MIDAAAARTSTRWSSAAACSGLEAANGLMLRGMDVTVVHVMPWLMERQLDDVAGKLLQKSLEERGLKFLIGAQTPGAGRRRRRPRARPSSSRTAREIAGRPGGDGRRHPPQHRAGREDAACTATAASSSTTPCRPSPTRASTRWANARRTAASPTAWWRRCSSRARCAPTHLAQFGIGRYTGSSDLAPSSRSPASTCSPPATSWAAKAPKRSCMSDPFGGVYKKLVIKDDKLVGACLYGDTVDGSWYFKLLREGRSDRRHPRQADVRRVEHRRRRPRGPQQGRRAWPTATRSAAATASTRAPSARPSRTRACSRSTRCASTPRPAPRCGSCTGLVEQILMFTAGGDYSAAPKKKAMCGCTDAQPPGRARRDPRATSC